MNYDLNQLIDWTRRAGGDVITPQNETVVSDGTLTLTLNNDGFIDIRRLVNNDTNTDVAVGDYELSGSTIILDSAPVDGTEFLVLYDNARYSSEQILSYLVDGAKHVAGELRVNYDVNSTTGVVDDRLDVIYFPATDSVNAGKVDHTLENLIVLRAARLIWEAKAGQATDDAAKIKDADTSIDTEVAARAAERGLKRILEEYHSTLQTALSSRFQGSTAALASGPFDQQYYPYSSLPFAGRYLP